MGIPPSVSLWLHKAGEVTSSDYAFSFCEPLFEKTYKSYPEEACSNLEISALALASSTAILFACYISSLTLLCCKQTVQKGRSGAVG